MPGREIELDECFPAVCETGTCYLFELCKKYNVIELVEANYDRVENLTASRPEPKGVRGAGRE
jgi:hypothetical protein